MIKFIYGIYLQELIVIKSYKNKSFLIFCIIISFLLGFYGLYSLKINKTIQTSLVHVEFNSSKNNLKSKNLCYKIFVKNNGDKPVNFQLIFTRKATSNYPYLESIPPQYKSEILTIKEKESKYLELKSIYLSTQNSNTGGFYDNFEVVIQYKN